jgi:hypothetical protein
MDALSLFNLIVGRVNGYIASRFFHEPLDKSSPKISAIFCNALQRQLWAGVIAMVVIPSGAPRRCDPRSDAEIAGQASNPHSAA